MNRTELIHQFCDIVNHGLSQGHDFGKVAYEQLITAISDRSDKSLLDQLYQSYCLALEPHNFFNVRVQEPNERFEQCYELIRISFDEAERDPRENFLEGGVRLKNEHQPSSSIMIGRFWHALGLQQYDPSGQLKEFAFNPLVVTDSIMSVISGTYMSLQGSHREHEGIGAIGHIATRTHFRRGKGHGTVLVEAFEREVETTATARGDKLRLILLEAEPASKGFWVKQGYRWAAGTRYSQPPLEFDPVTGERFHDEVPEYLMVKVWNEPAPTHIDAQLLADAVHTMYQNWCLAKIATYTPEAARHAAAYVFGKVFVEFVDSLPPGGEPVPLQDPPSS